MKLWLPWRWVFRVVFEMGPWDEGLSDWGRRFGVVGRSLVVEAVWVLGSWVSGWDVGVVVTDWGIDRLGRVLSVEMLGSIIWVLVVRVAFSGWEIHSLSGVEMLVSRVRSKGVGVAFSGWEIHSLGGFLSVETIFATGAGDTGFCRGVV